MFQNKFKTKYLIVDLSYLIHHRTTATFSWLNYEFKNDLPFSPNECSEYDFTFCDEYMEMYEKNFLYKIFDIAKRNNVFTHNIIFAEDCRRSEIWRKDLFPEYKENRNKETKPTSPNFGTVWNHTYKFLLPALEEQYNIKRIKVDRAEADDVIAITTKYLEKKKEPDSIIVVCNDMDIAQLSSDLIEIVDLNNDSLTEKMIQQYNNPKDLVLFKVLAGDSGDNISSIKYRKVGEKTAKKMIKDPNLLKEFFEKYPESKETFKLNTQLISFKHIPDNIKKEIVLECHKHL